MYFELKLEKCFWEYQCMFTIPRHLMKKEEIVALRVKVSTFELLQLQSKHTHGD